jgi:hypothetical protein
MGLLSRVGLVDVVGTGLMVIYRQTKRLVERVCLKGD